MLAEEDDINNFTTFDDFFKSGPSQTEETEKPADDGFETIFEIINSK